MLGSTSPIGHHFASVPNMGQFHWHNNTDMVVKSDSEKEVKTKRGNTSVHRNLNTGGWEALDVDADLTSSHKMKGYCDNNNEQLVQQPVLVFQVCAYRLVPFFSF